MATSDDIEVHPDEAAEEASGGDSQMVPGTGMALAPQMPESDIPPALGSLSLQLDVSVPVRGFRVRDLLALAKGAVIASEWPDSEDLPIWCGGAQLVWTEFEVVDDMLAVRVTRVL